MPENHKNYHQTVQELEVAYAKIVEALIEMSATLTALTELTLTKLEPSEEELLDFKNNIENLQLEAIETLRGVADEGSRQD